MSALPRWMRCLTRKNARLLRLPGRGKGYGVFIGKDRRCRPLVRVDNADVRARLSEGILVEIGEAIMLSQSGHCRVAETQENQGREEQSQFANQHRKMTEKPFTMETGKLETHSVNARENPLYPWSKYLDPVEMAAGDQFRSDYTVSSLHQRTTQSWDLTAHHGGSSASYENMPLAKLQAKDRVMAALSAVGSGMDQLLMAVCIHEEKMGAVERRFGWVQRSGKSILKLALRQLAEHYGMVARG